MVFVTLAEIVAVHIFLLQFSEVAAWLLTGLSIYGALWMLGDYHAIRLHPVAVYDDRVVLDCGLRWRMEIPRSAIARAHRFSGDVEEYEGLNLAVLRHPTVVLELTAPHAATNLFGREKASDRVALSIDDAERFLLALGE